MTKNARDATFGSRECVSQQLPKSLQLDMGTRYARENGRSTYLCVTMAEKAFGKLSGEGMIMSRLEAPTIAIQLQ